MNKPLIKICGVKSANIARQAALFGADFIGIVFHPQSKRYVSLDQAKEISIAAIENGARPVAIFVEQSSLQMIEICLATHIQIVQLHGHFSRKQHVLLPEVYQRFYVQSVSSHGIIDQDDDYGLIYCDPKRDFLLFDNVKPGHGQPFAWNEFYYHGHFSFALAGGLTAENVLIAIKKFQPAIVDVSSGVENKSGEKDLSLIKHFIDTVRGYDHEHQ